MQHHPLGDRGFLSTTNYLVPANDYSHTENYPTSPGFTGATVKDRLAAVGYSSYAEGEELSYGAIVNLLDYVQAIRGLITAPYHGLGLLNGHHDFGMAKGGTTASVYVVNFATKTMGEHSLVPAGEVRVWPCNGIKDIPNMMKAAESPSPIPGRNFGTDPIGTPTYVIIGNNGTLRLSSYEIRGPSGAVAIAKVLGQDVADLLGANPQQMAVIPDKPLAFGTTYTSTITGTNSGAPFTKVCQFTTSTS